MKKTSNGIAIVVHVTTCRRFATATAGNLQIYMWGQARLRAHEPVEGAVIVQDWRSLA